MQKSSQLILVFFCSLYTLGKDMPSNWKKEIWKSTDKMFQSQRFLYQTAPARIPGLCTSNKATNDLTAGESKGLYPEECRTTTGSQTKEILSQISLFLRIWVKQNIYSLIYLEIDWLETCSRRHGNMRTHTGRCKRIYIRTVHIDDWVGQCASAIRSTYSLSFSVSRSVMVSLMEEREPLWITGYRKGIWRKQDTIRTRCAV